MPPPALTTLVPLRTGGKTRLAPMLRPDERAALAGAMLADVVEALDQAGAGRIVVAAQGPAAGAAAAALGLEIVTDHDHGLGLDRALEHATRRLAATRQLLVVPADLPCLTADDVAAVLGARGAVVVAPTRDGGTGALLRRPPTVVGTAYGAGSAAAHLRLATRAGATARTVHTPGFTLDVDTIHDLRHLPPERTGARTAQLMADLGLRDRRAG